MVFPNVLAATKYAFIDFSNKHLNEVYVWLWLSESVLGILFVFDATLHLWTILKRVQHNIKRLIQRNEVEVPYVNFGLRLSQIPNVLLAELCASKVEFVANQPNVLGVTSVSVHILIEMRKVFKVDWPAYSYKFLDNFEEFRVTFLVLVLVLATAQHEHHSDFLGDTSHL